MTLGRWIIRILRAGALALLAVFLLAFLVTKVEMFVFQFRAERLMNDLHRVRLYQTSWSDAQELMRRWGEWGHYDGSCTASDCHYVIQLSDQGGPASRVLASGFADRLFGSQQFRVYDLLGDRYPGLWVVLTVHQGTIWRTSASASIGVPSEIWKRENGSYVLKVETKSRQRLKRTASDWWIMGAEEQLAEHPYYKAGRPGGCEICEEAVVAYSTRTPQAEIDRLTSFDFSCVTRLIACRDLGQLLPAAVDWHLYEDDVLFAIDESHRSDVPRPCGIPVWALARDHANVIAAEALTVQMVGDGDRRHEVVTVRVKEILKGSFPWPVGKVLMVAPYSGDLANPPFKLAEHMVEGQRYLLLPDEDEGDKIISPGEGLDLSLVRCGLRLDTPAARKEVAKGIAQNDDYPLPELR